jgi:SPP1 family predicted phage head-tail adaptor
MQAGMLRNRVEVEAHVAERDDGGGVVERWERQLTRWAAIRPLLGREILQAQALDPRITHKVTLRYLPTLTAEHRLVFGERIFNILTPPLNTGERNEETTCFCMEHASGSTL